MGRYSSGKVFLQFQQLICRRFGWTFCRGAESHLVTAQSRREDAVGFRAALLWGIFVDSSACFILEGLPIQLESVAGGFVALFQHSSLASALCLGETAFSLRRASGVFFGGGPFASWFLGFPEQ